MKKIDCLSLGTMCEVLLDGEPVFILRAQDAASVPALEDYLKRSKEKDGANLLRTSGSIERFKRWQAQHPDKVRAAD